MRGPGVVNMDLSIYRTFEVTERYKLRFQAEAFNLTNTPHFNNPNGDVTDSNFGIVSSTTSNFRERTIRFGLKLSF